MNVSLIELDNVICQVWLRGHAKTVTELQKLLEHVPLLPVMVPMTFSRSFEIEQFGLFDLYLEVSIGRPIEKNVLDGLPSPTPMEREIAKATSQASFAIPKTAKNLPTVRFTG